MKTTFIPLLGVAVLGMTLLCNSLAWAGAKSAPEVDIRLIINPDTYVARGSMVGARYSNDTQQSIGCTYTVTSGGEYVSCWAMDRLGRFFTCSSTNPNLFTPVRTMTDSSFIQILRDKGKCIEINIDNDSKFLK